MTHFPSRNIHPEFDNLVTTKLGHYVYLLRDPKDHAPFYVGKGGGKVSDGNERVLDHFKEARRTPPMPKFAAERSRASTRFGSGAKTLNG